MKYLIILLVFTLISCSQAQPEPREEMRYIYQVELTYCDCRKPDTIPSPRTTYQNVPSKLDIYNRNLAVPQWYEYMNVCDVRVIGERDSIIVKY